MRGWFVGKGKPPKYVGEVAFLTGERAVSRLAWRLSDVVCRVGEPRAETHTGINAFGRKMTGERFGDSRALLAAATLALSRSSPCCALTQRYSLCSGRPSCGLIPSRTCAVAVRAR